MATRALQFALLLGLPASWIPLLWEIHHSAPAAIWLFWLPWPIMVLHQIEEHILTPALLGPRYRFDQWALSLGYRLSPTRIFWLNVGVGWTLALAVGFVGTRFIFFSLFVIGVELVNGLWHLYISVRKRNWSPGTLTGIALTTPSALLIISWTLKHALLSPLLLIATLIASCLAHAAFLQVLPRTPPPPRQSA